MNRVTSLENTVANLDNYRTVVETSVHFAFNKDNLTSKARKALDELANEIPNARATHYGRGRADAVRPKLTTTA